MNDWKWFMWVNDNIFTPCILLSYVKMIFVVYAEKHGTCSSSVVRDEYGYFLTALNVYFKYNVTVRFWAYNWFATLHDICINFLLFPLLLLFLHKCFIIVHVRFIWSLHTYWNWELSLWIEWVSLCISRTDWAEIDFSTRIFWN